MADVGRRGIYRIRIRDGHQVKIVKDIMCPYALSLDYNTRDLYWTETCTFQLKTSKIDGSDTQILPTVESQFFAHGSSVYQGHLYWTQISEQSTIECHDRKTKSNNRIFTLEESVILLDLQIVHSSLQPSSKPLVILIA